MDWDRNTNEEPRLGGSPSGVRYILVGMVESSMDECGLVLRVVRKSVTSALLNQSLERR